MSTFNTPFGYPETVLSYLRVCRPPNLFRPMKIVSVQPSVLESGGRRGSDFCEWKLTAFEKGERMKSKLNRWNSCWVFVGCFWGAKHLNQDLIYWRVVRNVNWKWYMCMYNYMCFWSLWYSWFPRCSRVILSKGYSKL